MNKTKLDEQEKTDLEIQLLNRSETVRSNMLLDSLHRRALRSIQRNNHTSWDMWLLEKESRKQQKTDSMDEELYKMYMKVVKIAEKKGTPVNRQAAKEAVEEQSAKEKTFLDHAGNIATLVELLEETDENQSIKSQLVSLYLVWMGLEEANGRLIKRGVKLLEEEHRRREQERTNAVVVYEENLYNQSIVENLCDLYEGCVSRTAAYLPNIDTAVLAQLKHEKTITEFEILEQETESSRLLENRETTQTALKLYAENIVAKRPLRFEKWVAIAAKIR